jgi:hypothetical protein
MQPISNLQSNLQNVFVSTAAGMLVYNLTCSPISGASTTTISTTTTVSTSTGVPTPTPTPENLPVQPCPSCPADYVCIRSNTLTCAKVSVPSPFACSGSVASGVVSPAFIFFILFINYFHLVANLKQ